MGMRGMVGPAASVFLLILIPIYESNYEYVRPTDAALISLRIAVTLFQSFHPAWSRIRWHLRCPARCSLPRPGRKEQSDSTIAGPSHPRIVDLWQPQCLSSRFFPSSSPRSSPASFVSRSLRAMGKTSVGFPGQQNQAVSRSSQSLSCSLSSIKPSFITTISVVLDVFLFLD